jgi:four helix bundle protein
MLADTMGYLKFQISDFKSQISNLKPHNPMTYQRFEDLPVWQDAIRLAEGCENFLIAAKGKITFSKRDQLDRCSLSVSNNIAEGFERGTTNELLAFLYIARGSAGETRSMLCFFERRPALQEFKAAISNLKSLAEGCSRQVRAWAESLQNSDIAGPRHLNQRSRKEWEKKQGEEQRHQEFMAAERAIIAKLPSDNPARQLWESRHGPLHAPPV